LGGFRGFYHPDARFGTDRRFTIFYCEYFEQIDSTTVINDVKTIFLGRRRKVSWRRGFKPLLKKATKLKI